MTQSYFRKMFRETFRQTMPRDKLTYQFSTKCFEKVEVRASLLLNTINMFQQEPIFLIADFHICISKFETKFDIILLCESGTYLRFNYI